MPPEVRSSILEELLWRDVPLVLDRELCDEEEVYDDLETYPLAWPDAALYHHVKPLRYLDVAILRTSRQLYLEGKGILYNNTLGCYVGHPADPASRRFTFPFILHDNFKLRDESTHSVWEARYFSKANINMFCHHENVDVKDDFSGELGSCLRDLSEIVRKAEGWKYVDIQVFHTYDLRSGTINSPRRARDARHAREALSRLRTTRDRQIVNIDGLPQERTAWLPKLMVSCNPYVEMSRIQTSLSDYIEALMSQTDYHLNHAG